LLFKSYYVSDYLNYLPAIQNASALPMTAKDHFHQQFQLSLSDSIESNSNLFINNVDLKNERIWFFMPTKEFTFVDLIPINVWKYADQSIVKGDND
jgi:hypothetical protein